MSKLETGTIVSRRKEIPRIAKEEKLFKNLHNELPETEVEAKLEFENPDEVEPDILAKSIMGYFAAAGGDYGLRALKPLVSVSDIDKYHYNGRNISVVRRRADGETFIKQKTYKDTSDTLVIVATEVKAPIQDRKKPFRKGILRQDISSNDITLLGNLVKQKYSLIVENKETRRVYRIMVDRTNLKNGQEDELKQIEIEYIGVPHANSVGKRGVARALIINDVATIRDEIKEYLDRIDIPVKPTTATKTAWLKSVA